MEANNMDRIMNLRKQVVSRFLGITIDMDYHLCIPSIHATYQEKEIVVDFGCKIREMNDGFPEDKIELLLEWIDLHKKEIAENHFRLNTTHETLLPIAPLIP